MVTAVTIVTAVTTVTPVTTITAVTIVILCDVGRCLHRLSPSPSRHQGVSWPCGDICYCLLPVESGTAAPLTGRVGTPSLCQ